MRRKLPLLLALFGLLLLWAQQKEVKVSQGVLKADRIEIDWQKNTLTAYPNPVFYLPDMEVKAGRITLCLDQKGTIVRTEASDGVSVKIVQVLQGNVKQTVEGQGDKATFTGGNILTLEGKAEVRITRSDREGTSVIKGNKINIDMEKKSLWAEGDVELQFPLPAGK